jgi:hypothetical protein
MSTNEYRHRNIVATFNQNRDVSQITYDGHPLLTAIAPTIQGIQLTPQGIILPASFQNMIIELLELIASLPPEQPALKINLADVVFGHLIVEPATPNPKLKSAISQEILGIVRAWESSHEPVHKGTPYYFLAETFLSQGDIPSAYIYFFNAVEQDKTNLPTVGRHYQSGAAYLTTSLVDDDHNALYLQVVIPLRHYLQEFINRYNTRTNNGLDIQTVDNRFLQDPPLEDIKRFFVANFHEIYHLAPLNSSTMINNDYSKLKISDTLFNLSLIVDQVLQKRFLQGTANRDKNMANAIYRLGLHLRWTDTATDGDAGQFGRAISPHPNSGAPDQVLPHFLDNTATFHGNLLDSKKRAMFSAYHLRNFGGHNIEGQNVLVTRYPDILDAMMDALFVAIEAL